jgi:hypothetical protein
MNSQRQEHIHLKRCTTGTWNNINQPRPTARVQATPDLHPKWGETRNLFICHEFQQQCCAVDSGYGLGGSLGDQKPALPKCWKYQTVKNWGMHSSIGLAIQWLRNLIVKNWKISTSLLNSILHDLWRKEKCSSLASPRAVFIRLNEKCQIGNFW